MHVDFALAFLPFLLQGRNYLDSIIHEAKRGGLRVAPVFQVVQRRIVARPVEADVRPLVSGGANSRLKQVVGLHDVVDPVVVAMDEHEDIAGRERFALVRRGLALHGSGARPLQNLVTKSRAAQPVPFGMRRLAIGNVEEPAWPRLGAELLSVSAGNDISYAEDQVALGQFFPPVDVRPELCHSESAGLRGPVMARGRRVFRMGALPRPISSAPSTVPVMRASRAVRVRRVRRSTRPSSWPRWWISSETTKPHFAHCNATRTVNMPAFSNRPEVDAQSVSATTICPRTTDPPLFDQEPGCSPFMSWCPPTTRGTSSSA